MDNIKKLVAIGQLITTQDNRITAHPIFIVEKKVFDYGYDSAFSDDYIWLNSDDDHEEADEEMALQLETIDPYAEKIGGWQRVYYKTRWQFVTACFTEKACQDYINANRHNLGETRIYADSGYRNYEWQAIREALISMAALYGDKLED